MAPPTANAAGAQRPQPPGDEAGDEAGRGGEAGSNPTDLAIVVVAGFPAGCLKAPQSPEAALCILCTYSAALLAEFLKMLGLRPRYYKDPLRFTKQRRGVCVQECQRPSKRLYLAKVVR
jgi:hypothetical protein